MWNEKAAPHTQRGKVLPRLARSTYFPDIREENPQHYYFLSNPGLASPLLSNVYLYLPRRMSDQAANDAQASTGSHDDESTTSSHSAEEAPSNFHQRLAAWLTVYDRKVYLKEK